MSVRSINRQLSQAYLDAILAGDRVHCRQLIDEAFDAGLTAHELLTQLVWNTMELVQSLFRDDRISQSAMSLATMLNRSVAGQVATRLPRSESNGKKALIFCGNDEPEELGGQICAELFEHAGWNVRFAGGGVPDDEVLQMIGDIRPDLLVMFATLPSGVPEVRKLIDYLRDVNCCPELQVMCCGGIYKRAEGLAEEIGADLYAPDAESAVEVAQQNPSRRATVDQQTVGRTRRIRKAAARKAAACNAAAATATEPTPTVTFVARTLTGESAGF
jgi:methanogenic corrinoid protein MtbC1